MKKKVYLLLALLLAAAVIVVGVLFFVNREPQEAAGIAPEAPVIRLAEDLSVCWDRVENAESYIIRVNGNDLFSTENTSISVLSAPGTYKIQVQAANKIGKSDYSNEVSYQTVGVNLPISDIYTVLGSPVVGYGLDYTFALELAVGCIECEPVVKVNDQVITPDKDGNYTIANVTENLTVTVEGVELKSYPVTLPEGEGYTIIGEPVAYYGRDYIFTLTLDESYSKSQVVVKANDVELTPRAEGYVVPYVTNPQVITVSGVEENRYIINLPTGRGYKISPSGEQKVAYGQDVIFTVIPESSSYGITVQADGKTLSGKNGQYTLSDISADVQVTVTVTGLPAFTGVNKILDSESWNTASVAYDGSDLIVSANSVLKAEYLRSLWNAGYTHLVFTVNAQAAADNNTNFTNGGEWSRYWANFEPGKDVDLRIDLNEFHDGNTWYSLNFNAGSMAVSNPRAYKSAETLSWTKSNTNIYLAIENGYYVLETRGNDFGVTSPTQWVEKYCVSDDGAQQRTWLVYTDYMKQGNNTRSVIWGWGSPVSDLNIGEWSVMNNVQMDGYQQGEVFSLMMDRAGVARFKISDFVSNRNTWGTFRYSEVTDNSITVSGAVDQKLRYVATDELIAAGYTHLQVTFSGNIGDSVIYFGNDEWGADKYILGVSKNELTNSNDYTYTANVDLSRMNGNPFTLLVANVAVTDMTVTIQPAVLSTYNVTLPSGVGYTVSGEATAVSGSSYRFSVILNEGYTQSNTLVKVNGVAVTGANGVYTVENVQDDLSITVENITLNTYTVTKPESEDYAVSGADSVTHGESYTFSVTAIDPKKTIVVLVNGFLVTGTNGDYTVKNVKEDLVITVQATIPEPAAPEDILKSDSWTGTVLSPGSSLKLAANPTLKAEYLKSLWNAGYTHLVFTVNAASAGNFIHGGTWDRYWGTVTAGTQDLRIDLNEFHDGDTWYDMPFINMSGDMTVSAPKAYKSPETLNWVKDNSSTYFAMEDGYYVLETRGNDFGVKSPTQWLKKYVVKDDAGQRTWQMYTDYIIKGNNTRSLLWGWGSAVNTVNSNVNGGWSWNNNVSTDHEVFSLHLDRAGVARFKLLDWVSNRNGWNNALAISYVDEQTIRWSAASDYKLRLATTQDLIAAGYTTLKVTLTGNLGSAQIWYGEDDWSDGEIAVNAKDFVNGSYTFEVDLTAFKSGENFTMMVSGASFTNLQVKIQPVNKDYCSVTVPTGTGFVFTGEDTVKRGESYTFTVIPTGSENLIVSVNGVHITGLNGSYTVENVQEDLVITVAVADQINQLLLSESWQGNVLSSDGSSLKLAANPTLKAEYLESLWDEGYTHLVFTVNAVSDGNFIHGGTWDRYWGTMTVGAQDLRIDLNEFHDGDTWYDMPFINMSGDMTVSAPKAYKSPETLNWVKDNSSTYFAMEDGYYVLETRGNDFGVKSPTQWLKKYVVKDDASQRTWMMYTDYITKGGNNRSLLWGWGSPVNTINSNANGGWSWNNNVQIDGYTDGEVFSLHLDRAGVARFKLLDWVSNRNEWNGSLAISYVDEQIIRWSAASDYKLRLATTQDLIAAGYTTLKVTLTGNLGSAQIWYGEDDWGDGEIAVSADSFVDGSYTFEIDLTTFKPNENFTMMVNAAKITDLLVKIEPIAE